MSTVDLTTEAMALPIAERVSLAQALWQSIETGMPDSDEKTVIQEAAIRSQELISGAVIGRTHEEVMEAAKCAIGCT